jgi:hypothetical protein
MTGASESRAHFIYQGSKEEMIEERDAWTRRLHSTSIISRTSVGQSVVWITWTFHFECHDVHCDCKTMQLAWLLLLPLAQGVLSHRANDTLLWGLYRPNLYFGLRPRIPQSLMAGLMWFGTQDYQSISRQ